MTALQKPAPVCPMCKKPAAAGYAPFCSKGCRDRDLLKWLDDGYSVPGEPAPVPTDDLD